MSEKFNAFLLTLCMLGVLAYSVTDTVTIFYPQTNEQVGTPAYNVTYIFNGGVKNGA